MRLYFKCICCKKEKFILDKSSIGEVCSDCYSYICNLNDIPDYVIFFFTKHKKSLKELMELWNIPKDKRINI